MEELFPVLIFLIIGVANTISKAQKRAQTEARRQAASPVKPSAPAKPAHPYQPTGMPAMVFSDVPGQVIAPTVHPHVQPDCEKHDAPSGSLNVTTTEGKDPCHEKQLTHVRTVNEPVAEEEGGLTLDWTGENMVKAFIMQEVLARPAQRRRA
nr:hypothetical protein [Clostridia bacterium]